MGLPTFLVVLTSTLIAEVNSAHKKIVYYAPCSAVNSECSQLAGRLLNTEK